MQQPQSCLQSCGAVSTFFFFLQCSSRSPACRVVERSPPSSFPAVTVLPAELWTGLHLLLFLQCSSHSPACRVVDRSPPSSFPTVQQPQSCLQAPPSPSRPRRLHAVLAAFMRPSPRSCGPHRLHAVLPPHLHTLALAQWFCRGRFSGRPPKMSADPSVQPAPS